MKTLLRLALLVTALAIGASAQSGIVSEAKAKSEKEHHAALVVKAQHFLAEKAKLETRLEAVEKKLEKLEAGQDVKDDADDEVSLNYAQWRCRNGGDCLPISTNPTFSNGQQ